LIGLIGSIHNHFYDDHSCGMMAVDVANFLARSNYFVHTE